MNTFQNISGKEKAEDEATAIRQKGIQTVFHSGKMVWNV